MYVALVTIAWASVIGIGLSVALDFIDDMRHPSTLDEDEDL